MGNATPRSLDARGGDLVRVVLEAGWAPGPVWTGAENLPSRIRSPDRPSRTKPLYRPSYPGPPREVKRSPSLPVEKALVELSELP